MPGRGGNRWVVVKEGGVGVWCLEILVEHEGPGSESGSFLYKVRG